MNTEFVLLTAIDAPAQAMMTFPKYRPLLYLSEPNVTVVAARQDGQVIALALAVLAGDKAEILSLYVSTCYRRQGIGRGLLGALEDEMIRRGCSEMGAVWMNGASGTEGFAALLHGHQWTLPQPRMIVYRAELERLSNASWIHAFAHLPIGHAIVPWIELGTEQLINLKQAIRFEAWVSPELIPFDFSDQGIDGAPSEKRLNLAYTVWGEVVGWNFAHHLNTNTARISCTFVRPDSQQQLFMLNLWREVLVRLVDTEYKTISWAVFVERSAMINFNDAYMSPYLQQRSETWGSSKVLSSAPTTIVI